MDVVSSCPLRVASVVWQPRPGVWALTVVCKATFQLRPNVSPLAELQEPPVEEDGYWDDDEARSLHVPTDLVPFKARADILLVGHAFAPTGQAVRSLPVRLAVGVVDKRLDVCCDRIFWHDGRLLEGQPFTRMPLRWERAAGGPGTANPVGMRFDAPPDAHGAVPIPNLQPPGLHVTCRSDTVRPVGLGPIAPTWPDRAGKLGHHTAGWSHRSWHERPLPGDLDRAYFNAAPADQQLATLEPDERLVLEHLHPEHPRLATQLPGLRPLARMTAGGRAGEDVTLTADTLWIDTDRGLAALVWRGRVPLTHAAEAGRVTVSVEGAYAGGEVSGTVALGPDEQVPAALPFRDLLTMGETPVPPAQASSPGPAPAPIGPAPERSPPPSETLLGGRPVAQTLPFARGKSPWEVFQPQPAASCEPTPTLADTGTVYGMTSKAHGVLPSTWAAPQPARPAPLAEIDDEAAPPAPERRPQAEVPAPERLAPVAEPAPAEPASAEPAAPVPEAAPPEVSIERCAAIAASIARRPADRAKIMEEAQLSAGDWVKVDKRWDEALLAESRRGKCDLLAAYDAAYVGRLEEERGPIDVAEYARLVAASERGSVGETLAELGLPRGAMMRIERVWLRKLVKYAEVGAAVRRATKAAREA